MGSELKTLACEINWVVDRLLHCYFESLPFFYDADRDYNRGSRL